MVKTNKNNDNEETCVELLLDTILEDFLARVSLLTTSSNMISMALQSGMAREMPSSPTSSTTSSNLRVGIVTRR